MSVNFSSLVAQIADELQRNDADTLAYIPVAINNAQQRLCRDTKSLLIEQYVTGNFISQSNVITKPGRWRRTLSINYGTGANFNTQNQLLQRSYEHIVQYAPNPTQYAPPIYYADYGFDHIILAPTPDQGYPFRLAFLELPTPLSIQNQTNTLTNNAPDLLFYASLLEMIPFLRNFDVLPSWKEEYKDRLSSINDQDDRRFRDRASDRRSD